MKTKNLRKSKSKELKVSANRVNKWLGIVAQRKAYIKQGEEKGNRSETSGRGKTRKKAVAGMMEFLRERYLFRFNCVTGSTEYRQRCGDTGFLPLDRRVMKRMALEVEQGVCGATFNDVRYFLESDMLAAHDPLKEFLSKCRGTWDGTDRIRRLAGTVKCGNPNWTDWFYRWFLGMVEQWDNPVHGKLYGNSTVPLLISEQGFRKSTFCRRLLPPELSWGYCDSLVISEKRQVMLAMSQFLLVNLDEFNQISPTLQEGFLKNMLQLPTVKAKRPYGRVMEEMPRRASFIATSNITDPLSDPTGNRRFIAVELTEPIDVSQPIDYPQLYAQALAALDSGERGYFNQDETLMIMESNRRFEAKSPMEQCFKTVFRAAKSTDEGRFMTASEIVVELKSIYGCAMNVKGLSAFGRCLHAIPGLKHRMTSRGTEYLIRKNSSYE